LTPWKEPWLRDPNSLIVASRWCQKHHVRRDVVLS
jgi:hypothetical protein